MADAAKTERERRAEFIRLLHGKTQQEPILSTNKTALRSVTGLKRGRDLCEIFNWPATKAVYALDCTKVKRKNRPATRVTPYICVTIAAARIQPLNQ